MCNLFLSFSHFWYVRVCETLFMLRIYLILFFSLLSLVSLTCHRTMFFCLPLPFLAFNNFFLSWFFISFEFVSYLLAFTAFVSRVSHRTCSTEWTNEWMSKWANGMSERIRSQRFYYYCYFTFLYLIVIWYYGASWIARNKWRENPHTKVHQEFNKF